MSWVVIFNVLRWIHVDIYDTDVSLVAHGSKRRGLVSSIWSELYAYTALYLSKQKPSHWPCHVTKHIISSQVIRIMWSLSWVVELDRRYMDMCNCSIQVLMEDNQCYGLLFLRCTTLKFGLVDLCWVMQPSHIVMVPVAE